MDRSEAKTKVLKAADSLFYSRGLQTVGMKDIRDASGVSLKRLYQCFPSKDDLIAAYLDDRDRAWRAELREFVLNHSNDPQERVLAVFDALERWFREEDFRGCAYIHAFGELGATSSPVARLAREHKVALRSFLTELLQDADIDNPELVARQILMLVDGAMVSAAIHHEPASAQYARTAATQLLETASASG